MKVKIEGAERVTGTQYKRVSSRTVTVLPGTSRPGFAVVEYEGHRDDDFGQGEYHDERIIEVHEDEAKADERVDELNAAQAYQTENSSGGWETYVYDYKGYKAAEVVLHLCMIDRPGGPND